MTLRGLEFPLEGALGFLRRLWRLNHALEKLSSRMGKRLGVTAQQRLILRCVGKFPGMTAGSLATLLHVDPGTVSASLNRLERKGLIDRPRDPRDKRRASLRLTSKGRGLGGRVGGTAERAVERLLESTLSGDLALVVKVLEDLTTLLNEELQFESNESRTDAVTP